MKILDNFDLSEYNSYRVQAICERAVFLDTEDDILEYFNKYINRPKVIIGSGHNIILSKEKYKEDFVIFNNKKSNISLIEPNIIEADSASNMLDISIFALNHGLTGLEVFYDIPSSFGGAIVMNAGAGDEEIKNVLTKVRYLDLFDKKIKEISNKDIEFEYRNSFFQKNNNTIILKAWLKLNNGIKEDIKSKMHLLKQTRSLKQPKEYPNAGSVFKRPQGYYVGPMIEELGLKGFSIGGAAISEKHAGFIINKGNATGKDILDLIKIVQQKVKDRYGVNLEVEQKII